MEAAIGRLEAKPGLSGTRRRPAAVARSRLGPFLGLRRSSSVLRAADATRPAQLPLGPQPPHRALADGDRGARRDRHDDASSSAAASTSRSARPSRSPASSPRSLLRDGAVADGRRRWPASLVGGLVGLVNGARDHAAARRAVHRDARHARRRARRRRSGSPTSRRSTSPATWVNELAVTFPTPAWLHRRARRVDRRWRSPSSMAFVLRDTVFGRRVFALGSNEAAARACGIADRSAQGLDLRARGAASSGSPGVMQMSRLRQGDPTVAIGTELDVIAAVVIGGGSLARRRGQHPRLDDRRARRWRSCATAASRWDGRTTSRRSSSAPSSSSRSRPIACAAAKSTFSRVWPA